MNADFEKLLGDLQANGELITGEALADPASAKLYRWSAEKPVITDGPYSEAGEHFAGFFMIDVASPQRAEEVAAQFSGPGDTVEWRPAMWPGDGESASR